MDVLLDLHQMSFMMNMKKMHDEEFRSRANPSIGLVIIIWHFPSSSLSDFFSSLFS